VIYLIQVYNAITSETILCFRNSLPHNFRTTCVIVYALIRLPEHCYELSHVMLTNRSNISTLPVPYATSATAITK
jgi:hypothetical protein